MKLKRIGLTALAVGMLGGGASYAAGLWSTLPVVGAAAFCASTVTGTGSLGGITGQGQGSTGSICAQTIPAGPATTTGVEIIPADTNLTGGAPPQTVGIPLALFGSLNTKVNQLQGGDFATNLWQRGTSFASLTPTTSTMTADRWAVYSSGNTVTVNKQTGASDSIPASGLYASMRVVRPSGTDVTAITVGQTLDKIASQGLIGNNAVCSFYALAGAGFSAANSNLTVTPAYYTAADSATPGTNTDAFMKSTITGYQAAATVASVGTTATLASGVATVPISTTWTRYAISATIPSTNSSGTAVTGFGLKIGYTPVGTGGSTDWFEIEGVQCQAMPSTVTAALPNGVTAPTGFERVGAAQEAQRELFYSYVITDGAATLRYGMGQALTTGTAHVVVQFPEQMRETPALTVGTTISFGITQAAGAAQACATSIAGVASSISPTSAALLCTTGQTNVVAGAATQFIGAATGGLLTYSAEP